MIEHLVQNNLLSLPQEIYSPQQSRELLDCLVKTVKWQGDFTAFGRRFEIPRLQAWYADAGIHYLYADNKLQTNDWIEPLISIKRYVEDASAHQFNSVLLTYYRNGEDYVSWHADDEAELGSAPIIASLSLGASREFHYRHKLSTEAGSVELHNGSLLIMFPEFQQYWEHCVLPQDAVIESRLNLTFRKVVLSDTRK